MLQSESHARHLCQAWEEARSWTGLRGALAFVSRVLQKLAMSSAEVRSPTFLLQNASKASFSALWNSELLLKLSDTYCKSRTSNCQT